MNVNLFPLNKSFPEATLSAPRSEEAPAAAKKYRLASKLQEPVDMDELGNEDNGDYTCIIRSPDGRLQARFTAAKGDHERNRQFAKDPEPGYVGAEWGKA